MTDDQMGCGQFKMDQGQFTNGSNSYRKFRLKSATKALPAFEFISSNTFIAITILCFLFVICHVNAKHHHPQVV